MSSKTPQEYLKEDMFTRLVSTLLYSNVAQEKLIELAWEKLTDEEKRELALLLFEQAKQKSEKVITERLWKSYSRSFLATMIERTLQEVVKEPEFKNRFKEGLMESTRDFMNKEYEEIIKNKVFEYKKRISESVDRIFF